MSQVVPEMHRVSVTVLWVMGLQQVQSSIPSIIMITPFTYPSPNSVPPHVSCFWISFCFMFPFLFASSFPCSIFDLQTPTLNPNPDICPILITLICCYTLSHPKTCWISVTMLWAVGLRRVQSSVLSVIIIIPFTHPSPNSVPPLQFMFLMFVLFHVSVSIRIFVSVLFSIPEPEPQTPTLTYAQSSLPWYVLFGTFTFRSSCMLLSWKLTLIVPRTPRPNLRTLVCLSSEIQGQ